MFENVARETVCAIDRYIAYKYVNTMFIVSIPRVTESNITVLAKWIARSRGQERSQAAFTTMNGRSCPACGKQYHFLEDMRYFW